MILVWFSSLTLRRLPRTLCGGCRLFHPFGEAGIFDVAFGGTRRHAGVPDELEAMIWRFGPIQGTGGMHWNHVFYWARQRSSHEHRPSDLPHSMPLYCLYKQRKARLQPIYESPTGQ